MAPPQTSGVTASPAPANANGCPLQVIPGRSLGPIALGQDVTSLASSPLGAKSTFSDATTSFFDSGPFRVRACGGKVAEVWLDDLRKAPDCVSYDGKPIDRALAREKVTALFARCHELPPRHGGAFTECEGGGVRIGYGMGDFVQVRVTRPGSDIDDT